LFSKVEASLERNFSCQRCGCKGGHTEQVAMAGTGLSRVLGVRQFCYAFVSCSNCGYTETYNLRTLAAKANPDITIENLFAS
jgi:predicted nucleic-acid-binding Zn-ribbon protein